MLNRQLLFVLIIVSSLPLVVVAQTSKSEDYLKRYLSQLRISDIDKFLIIKSGCTGCEVKYSDTLKSVSDGQTIYLLFQRKGKYNIVSFDDFGRQRQYYIDTCSLFDTIVRYKTILRQKETFYKKELAELRKAKFLPPKPSHYNFQELNIQLPNFKYEFKLVKTNLINTDFKERKRIGLCSQKISSTNSFPF